MESWGKYKVGDKLKFYCPHRHRIQSPIENIIKRKTKRGTLVLAVSTCKRHGNKMFRILGRE